MSKRVQFGADTALVGIAGVALFYFFWKSRPAIENTATLVNEATEDALHAYDYVRSGQAIDDAKAAASAAANWIEDEATSAVQTVEDIAEQAWTATTQAVQSATNSVVQEAQDIWHETEDAAQTAWDRVEDTATNVENTVEEAWDSTVAEAEHVEEEARDWWNEMVGRKPTRKDGTKKKPKGQGKNAGKK